MLVFTKGANNSFMHRGCKECISGYKHNAVEQPILSALCLKRHVTFFATAGCSRIIGTLCGTIKEIHYQKEATNAHYRCLTQPFL